MGVSILPRMPAASNSVGFGSRDFVRVGCFRMRVFFHETLGLA